MRALDDILIGFLIFFALDRAIRLFSNGVVEPWAEERSPDKTTVENWKLGSELVLLIFALGIVISNQKLIGRFNRT